MIPEAMQLDAAFLICPVRGHEADKYAATVAAIEASGIKIHWPPRDTNQVDDIGLRICGATHWLSLDALPLPPSPPAAFVALARQEPSA